MTVTLQVPLPLRIHSGAPAEIALAASSVRDALTQIERSHPALYAGICDETGKVRRHVNLFVNTAHIRDRGGLDTPLVPGDALVIMPAVSGG
jgi:molybdopterin synthase sulfur carrier subunit